MPPKKTCPASPKTEKNDVVCVSSFTEFAAMMKTMMENLTEIMRASFEKQTDVLHHEIFSLKDTLDQERQKRKKLEKENENLQADMTQIRRDMQYLNDRLDEYDQNTRNCDVVFVNINGEEVKDVRDFTTKLVNDALMGKVLDKNDSKKQQSSKIKKIPQNVNYCNPLL